MEESHLQHLFLKYSQMLYKISVLMLCNEQDANDAVQDTFIRYLSADKCFGDEEHEKAWLIRVNINICKNMLRFRRMHPTTTYEDLTSCLHSAEDIGLMNALLELKEKDKEPLILYYIEGYSCREISGFLGISEGAVKKRLERARKRLRDRYEQNRE